MIEWHNMFQTYGQALDIWEEKISLVSSNITNQDTPGYRARDINFKEAMAAAEYNSARQINSGSGVGFSNFGFNNTNKIQYRTPTSASVDGNTVNPHSEKVAFMDSVVRYNSTLAFIQSRKAALLQVIKGD